MGRAAELVFLVKHASWVATHRGDTKSILAARRLLQNGIDCIQDEPLDHAALAMDS